HGLHFVGPVTVAGDQLDVGAGWRHGRAGIDRAAVGTDVDRVGEAIGTVVVAGDVGDPRPGGGRRAAWIAQGPGLGGLVVEALARGHQNGVAVGIVGCFGLAQDEVIVHVAGVAPGAVAAAVADIGLGDAGGAVELGLGHQPAGLGVLEDVAATVVPQVDG